MNPSIIISLVLALWIHPAFATEELPRSQPENVGLSSDRLQRLSDVLEGYVNDGKLAGAVALVARKGKVVYFTQLIPAKVDDHGKLRALVYQAIVK